MNDDDRDERNRREAERQVKAGRREARTFVKNVQEQVGSLA